MLPPLVLHLAIFVSFVLTSALPSLDYHSLDMDKPGIVLPNCRYVDFAVEQNLYLDPCYTTYSVLNQTSGLCYPGIVVEDKQELDNFLFIFGPQRSYYGDLLGRRFNYQKEQPPCTPVLALFGSTLLILGNCSGTGQDLPSGVYYPLLCRHADLDSFYKQYKPLHSGILQLHCGVLVDEGVDPDIKFTREEANFNASWGENDDASYGVCGTTCSDRTVRFRSCPYLYDFDHHSSFPGSNRNASVIEGQHRAMPAFKKIMLGGFVLLAVLVSAFLWSYSLFFRRRLKKSILSRRRRSKKDRDLELLLHKFQDLMPTRYSYSDVVKITSSFREKLGRGGCGSVYGGSLQDGRPVAVKVLSDSKSSVKDFFAEVVAIGCTYHVNIVALLGFCSEGPNRVLIFEFMSNGSLEKLIYRDKQLESPALDPAKLLDIAIGVARGLEYLHHGCNVGILHFDIKPHNILLDHDLCPKIADFGLSKLCRSADGWIRMLGARGTIGYIAPEVFSRHYGGVSSKSDVYSYGMMILEMVGGRRSSSSVVQVDNTSEVYLPHWICRHLDLDGNLRSSLRSMTGEEEEIARRMVIVGLWCIQTRPSDRPSMTKVLDMLEGRITELQMPLMPVLSSPPRSSVHCSLTNPSRDAVSTVPLSQPHS